MPYTVRAAAVASDHAVIAKAIDVWMAVPENAVGLSSPTLDQVKKHWRKFRKPSPIISTRCSRPQ